MRREPSGSWKLGYAVPNPSDFSYAGRQPYNSDKIYQNVVVSLICILISVGVIYLAYSLFIKDCILLCKAKRQRTTTEIGFGQTPQVTNNQGNQL
jgi:hypothetical protein